MGKLHSLLTWLTWIVYSLLQVPLWGTENLNYAFGVVSINVPWLGDATAELMNTESCVCAMERLQSTRHSHA